MNGNELLDKMEWVDPAYVTEADARPARRGHGIWLRWAAAAACVCLIGLTAWRALPQGGPSVDPVPDDLPLLTIPEDLSGGMGYEGYLAADVSQLSNANPWTPAMELTHLPVFANPLLAEEAQTPAAQQAGAAAMQQRLEAAVEALGLTGQVIWGEDHPTPEQEAEIREKLGADQEAEIREKLGADAEAYLASLSTPGERWAWAEGVTLRVDQTGSLEVKYDPPRPLPEGQHLNWETAGPADYARAAPALVQEYAPLLGMEKPVVNVSGGDATTEGTQLWTLSFYEGAGTPVEQILHYQFAQAAFIGSWEAADSLWIIRLHGADLSRPVGDYPILTPDEAQQLLCAGRYVISVPGDTPAPEAVRKVELVYQTDTWAPVWMPYYRFYVEMPPDWDVGGMHTYGAYYVPAVQPDYLTNLPQWDGSIQ